MKWPSINWGYYPKIGRWHPEIAIASRVFHVGFGVSYWGSLDIGLHLGPVRLAIWQESKEMAEFQPYHMAELEEWDHAGCFACHGTKAITLEPMHHSTPCWYTKESSEALRKLLEEKKAKEQPDEQADH